jgi:hypothetical protein
LAEKLLKGAKEQALARKASKLVVKISITDEIKVTPVANLAKEKRKLPAADEQLEPAAKKSRLTAEAARLSDTDHVKNRPAAALSKTKSSKLPRPSTDHNSRTTAGPTASRVEGSLQLVTPREQRRVAREQLFALEAIKAASKTEHNDQIKPRPTVSLYQKEDQSRRRGTNHRSGNTTKRVEKNKLSTSNKQLSNGEKKRRLVIKADKAAEKPSGSTNQVKVRLAAAPSAKENQDPPSRMDHFRGKSPAIDPNSDFETDFESEVEEELSPRVKKQQLLAVSKEKRLALQAARAAKPQTLSPPSPATPVASSSRSTTPQPGESTPATPVRECITASRSPPPVSTAPDSRSRSSSSETSRPRSQDSKNSSDRSRRSGCSKAAVRRFIKD